MGSLRARLLAVTAAVLAAVLTALALFSARITRIEFNRFEDVLVTEHGEPMATIRRTLEAAYGAGLGWTAAQSAVDHAAAASGKEIFVVDSRGAPVARSAGLAQTDIVAESPGRFRIEWHGGPAKRLLIRAPGVPIADASGKTVGHFYVLPRDSSDPEARQDFAGAANRWLAFAVAGAGLLSLVLIAALSRRLLGPIESLTDAARRMETGDRTVRVPVDSVDELGRLARSFNSMADAIARQETLRRNLVHDVAHELRTPLTGIRAQLEALQDGLANPDGKTIDSLYEDARLLERLVDDLQELALAEAGQLALAPEFLPLADAAERAAAALQDRARGQRVAIGVSVPRDLAVRADRGRIGQVFSNLLVNALTHTPAGGRIEISARSVDGAIETEVADTGSGIEARHLPHVFDRFYRTDPSRTRATGGTGLGLAIVRQIVEAHGGTVRASSEPGRGTEIVFTLPAADLAVPGAPVAAPQPSPPS